MTASSKRSLVGDKLGVYRIEAELGRGGMGEVYRGVHELIARPVAIKVLKAEIAASESMISRFFAEARTVNLIRHENIVEVTDLVTEPSGRSYMVMELLEGRSLGQAIRDAGRLDPQRAVRIAAQIADAIHAAHDKGVVHRDLKPDNVFLIRRMGSADYVKVLDFGIARLHAEMGGLEATKTGALIGTPAYMSPEQVNGEKATAATDIYALGVILFQMLTGRLPFDTSSLTAMLIAHSTERPPPVTMLAPAVPPALAEVVAQALAKGQSERPPSMRALQRSLLTAVGLPVTESGSAGSSSSSSNGPSGSSGKPPASAPRNPASASMWTGPTVDITGSEAKPDSASGASGSHELSPSAVGSGTGPGAHRPMGAVLGATHPLSPAAEGRREPAPSPATVRLKPAASTEPGYPSSDFSGNPSGNQVAFHWSSSGQDQGAGLGMVQGRTLPLGAMSTGNEEGAQSSGATPRATDDRSHGSFPGHGHSDDPGMQLQAITGAPEPSDMTGAAGYGTERRHPRAATPLPSQLIEPKARRLPIVPLSLAALALIGVTAVLFFRREPDPSAAKQQAGIDDPARPLRERFTGLVLEHREPPAPASCQTRDPALLGTLISAAGSLRGGRPGGGRPEDNQALAALANAAPEAAEYWYWLAKARLYAGDNHAGVLEAADRALALCEGYAAAYSAKGTAEFRSGDDTRAAEQYSRAAKLDEEYLAARFNLGLVQLKTGSVDQGIESLSAVIMRDPKYPDAYMTRGQAYLMAREYDEALRDLERATELMPESADALWLLSQAYQRQGREDDAMKAACRAAGLGHSQAAARCEHPDK